MGVGLGAMLPLLAYGASQGSLGSTSTGTISISLDLTDNVRISGLSDIELSTVDGLVSTGETSACLFSSQPNNVQVQALGAGDGSAFALSSGSESVSYDVRLEDSNGSTALIPGTSVSRTVNPALDPDCTVNGPNARFTVTVDHTDVSAPGIYSGVLTLVLTAE